MVTDPIANLITVLKNGSAVGRETITTPVSNVLYSIAGKLEKEGFITKSERGNDRTMTITLKYENGKSVINGAKRISKPGRRLYKGMKEIFPVRYGTGSLIISTPKGIMTGEEARKAKVGGEPLFEIW